MAPQLRKYGMAATFGLAHLVLLLPYSFGQVRRPTPPTRPPSTPVTLPGGIPPQIPGRPAREGPSPGRFVFPPFNPFVNYPLTPYVGVGQAAAIARTMAFASFYGFPPPGYNPVANFPLTPYLGVGQAAGIMSTLGGGFPGYGYAFAPPVDPFLATVGYPGAYGYPAMYGMGYGGAGYGGGGYGGSGGYGSMRSNANSAVLTTVPAAPASPLEALRRHGGGLDWPLGLRVLEPKDEMKELRKQIDDAVETMFRQPGGPEKAPHLLADVQKEVERLGRIYKSQVWDMALTDQQEKDVRRFLHKVRAALLAAADAAAYDSELKTKAKPGSQYGSGGQPQTQGQYPAQSSAPMQEPVPAPATQPVGPNVAPQAPAGNLPNQPSTQPNQPKQPPNQPSPQPKPPSQPKPKGPPPVKEKQ